MTILCFRWASSFYDVPYAKNCPSSHKANSPLASTRNGGYTDHIVQMSAVCLMILHESINKITISNWPRMSMTTKKNHAHHYFAIVLWCATHTLQNNFARPPRNWQSNLKQEACRVTKMYIYICAGVKFAVTMSQWEKNVYTKLLLIKYEEKYEMRARVSSRLFLPVYGVYSFQFFLSIRRKDTMYAYMIL